MKLLLGKSKVFVDQESVAAKIVMAKNIFYNIANKKLH
jgi:hypothetical protein